ncbi:MAG: VanZ family protein [Candidatus Thiodiazotropha sp.]
MTGTFPAVVLRHYLLALGLSALTWLFFTLMPSYVPGDVQMLVDPGFSQDLASWQVGGTGKGVRVDEGVLTLSNASPRSNSSVFQCFNRRDFPDQAMIFIEARTEPLILGEKPWSEARVGLLLKDTQGKNKYQLSNCLVRLKQAQPWTRYETVLPIPHDLERVCFKVSLISTQGVFQVKNPGLYTARMLPSFRIGWWILLLVWVACLWNWSRNLFGLYPVSRQGILIWVIVGLMAFGILMSNQTKMELLQLLEPWLPERHAYQRVAINAWAEWLPMFTPGYWDITKFSHLLGFFLLSATLLRKPKASISVLVTGMLVVAVCSETLQYFASGRSPQLSDMVVDSLGILMGWWLMAGVMRVKRVVSLNSPA